ncbi:ATP synthase subunit b, mitochondrial-like [Amyelois transitella]|uniref:ATP synthase subunit b, mitochondrial-like n=1 Tax=Amyelois transitella TaxID=680683 RepID=UPI00298FDF4B|nr:ATP synthase subunit b, mitochondrial-like [Amyelois transitella]
MFAHQLIGSLARPPARTLYVPTAIYAKHSPVCPVGKGGSKGSPSAGGSKGGGLKRRLTSGKVRLAFIPEEWFQFFHSKTGVSGPYVFGLAVANYCLSKEIYVMEHEYYLGLSIFIVIALVHKNLGPAIAATLDKEVDDRVNELESGRKLEKDYHEQTIKSAKDAQWRAEGQKLLMDAKKENIAMQLEAIYRERMMHVYKMVRGRMDYHLKRYQSEARIHQKWMIGWILENVQKSITPEFEKQALDRAIQDLATAASQANK